MDIFEAVQLMRFGKKIRQEGATGWLEMDDDLIIYYCSALEGGQAIRMEWVPEASDVAAKYHEV